MDIRLMHRSALGHATSLGVLFSALPLVALAIGCGSPTPATQPTEPIVIGAPPADMEASEQNATSSGTSSTAPTSQPAKAEAEPDGEYLSPSCAPRTYARRIMFQKGFFRATDLVSPCPPGAQCVWSGIVERDGEYQLTHQEIVLQPGKPGGSQAQPLPPALGRDAATGLPFETSETGERCIYEPAP